MKCGRDVYMPMKVRLECAACNGNAHRGSTRCLWNGALVMILAHGECIVINPKWNAYIVALKDIIVTPIVGPV